MLEPQNQRSLSPNRNKPRGQSFFLAVAVLCAMTIATTRTIGITIREREIVIYMVGTDGDTSTAKSIPIREHTKRLFLATTLRTN
eukprot:scaffold114_cov175-Amphora_coffeaeformis.AAC.7